MSRLWKQFLKYSILAISSFALVTSFSPTQAQQPLQNVRDQLVACFPEGYKGESNDLRSISSTRFDETDYYLFHGYQKVQGHSNKKYIDNLIISVPVRGGSCKQEYFGYANMQPCFSEAVGTPVARQLALKELKQEVETLGRDRVRANLNQFATRDEQQQWCEETIWSYRQLGFEIPDNVIAK
ncbi:MAG: hypothetical protein GVY04_04995 [Cyanobacteria bacterium]|jgi:hypothetical protein|nr:hypothetical protein [Cyanobacteria bacterium GSL.Bin1]